MKGYLKGFTPAFSTQSIPAPGIFQGEVYRLGVYKEDEVLIKSAWENFLGETKDYWALGPKLIHL